MEEKTTNHRIFKEPLSPIHTHTQIHNRITEWSIQLIEEKYRILLLQEKQGRDSS